MNRQTSLYLDALRFLAAMTVFVGHVSGLRSTGGLLWQVGPYMEDAVTVFFVLSGFVIAYVAEKRESTAREYAVARAARIYSVAVPAVLATLVLDYAGRAIRPDLYQSWWGFSGDHSGWHALGDLLFVNRLWFAQYDLGSLLPYWSLCYEVWYYVIFGVVMFAPKAVRWPLTLLLLLAVGPRILMLFPIWLGGFFAYRVATRLHFDRRIGAVLCLGSVLGYVLFHATASKIGFPVVKSPLVNRPGLLQDYLVGAFAAANLIGLSALDLPARTMPGWLSRAVRWCAGATFTIYLFHLPVTQFLTTIVPWPASSWPTRLVMLAGALVILFAIAELTERRKQVWRELFWRATEGFAGVRPAVAAPGLTGGNTTNLVDRE